MGCSGKTPSVWSGISEDGDGKERWVEVDQATKLVQLLLALSGVLGLGTAVASCVPQVFKNADHIL
jgi:hypothetical protein